MVAEFPDVADPTNRRSRHRAGIIDVLDSRLTKLLDSQIDLGQAEPRDRQIEVRVKFFEL